MSKIEVRAHGQTDTGRVRKANEDAMLAEPELGLFAVFDGMGGANAGDVASRRARKVVTEYVRARRDIVPPKELLEAALQAASGAIFREARRNPDRHGMGTTVVACLMKDAEQVVIAHVGDSRAYLMRDRRMQLLTRDHTIVAELIANRAITPSEAVHHPYKNVLSRNLGGKQTARVDVLELDLQPGDRILLCSDGLTGFASGDAIEHVLSGAEKPEHAAQDLVDLALRGGGGDNITALIIEVGQAVVPRATQIIRTNGAAAWWRRRKLFLDEARARGLTDSPVCSVLSPDEALEIVAGNLSEAIFHDLQQTTGINVWTYAENLGKGWFDQDGDYRVLRDLFDVLRGAADAVIADVGAKDEALVVALEIAVTRALIVAEMALGGLLAEKLRSVEAEVVQLQAHQALAEAGDTVVHTFSDQPTMPYMSAVRVDPPSPDVLQCLDQARVHAADLVRQRGEKTGVIECLDRAHGAAVESVGMADAELAARDLFGMRMFEDAGVSPLLDALDQARAAHLQAISQVKTTREVRAAAVRRAAVAHRRMMYGVAVSVVESNKPVSDALRRAAEETATLRAEVGREEAKLAELERDFLARLQSETGPGDDTTQKEVSLP